MERRIVETASAPWSNNMPKGELSSIVYGGGYLFCGLVCHPKYPNVDIV